MYLSESCTNESSLLSSMFDHKEYEALVGSEVEWFLYFLFPFYRFEPQTRSATNR